MTTKKPEKGTKVAFIKQQPATMSAADVVAAAKKAGLTITTGYVYVVRSGAGAKKAAPTNVKAFKSLQEYVLRVGTDRAQRELDEIVQRFDRALPA